VLLIFFFFSDRAGGYFGTGLARGTGITAGGGRLATGDDDLRVFLVVDTFVLARFS